jgi:hypothetical protein
VRKHVLPPKGLFGCKCIHLNSRALEGVTKSTLPIVCNHNICNFFGTRDLQTFGDALSQTFSLNLTKLLAKCGNIYGTVLAKHISYTFYPLFPSTISSFFRKILSIYYLSSCFIVVAWSVDQQQRNSRAVRPAMIAHSHRMPR